MPEPEAGPETGQKHDASLPVTGVLITTLHDPPAPEPSPTYVDPPGYFEESLKDAELLLKFASESGIAVDAATRDYVLQARTACNTKWSEETIANLLSALATLAAMVKPVTAASLKAAVGDTERFIRFYATVAFCLALFIVPFSVASFVASSLTTSMRADIALANDLAVKLQEQLGYPQVPSMEGSAASAQRPCTPFPIPARAAVPANVNQNDVISELQLYASTIRSIDTHARQLNVLLLYTQRKLDPCDWLRDKAEKAHQVFQLPPGLPNLAQASVDRTTLYQDVRYFAQNLLDDISFYYGAISTCILPVMYALLGTCAYLLRNFEQEMTARTFVPSGANYARFLIAGIGGAVIGLFNNLVITQGASIPPLALAFLVGYAVDVFFAFLEGLLKSFTTKPPAASPPAIKTETKPV